MINEKYTRCTFSRKDVLEKLGRNCHFSRLLEYHHGKGGEQDSLYQ
jgi:hypothetical protein